MYQIKRGDEVVSENEDFFTAINNFVLIANEISTPRVIEDKDFDRYYYHPGGLSMAFQYGGIIGDTGEYEENWVMIELNDRAELAKIDLTITKE